MDLSWQEEKDALGEELVRLAYQSRCIETIFNTRDPEKRRNGWTLKNGTNSIYYINFRNAGNSAEFTAKLGYLMGRVLQEEVRDFDYDNDVIIGVDMAGVPLVSAVSTSMYYRTNGRVKIKWGYTRPLPGEKIRNVEDARTVLEELKRKNLSLGEWGSHNLIEGEILDGHRALIFDDMVTDFASKLIAREVIRYDADRRRIRVVCNTSVVGVDREQGADKTAKEEGMKLFHGVPMKTKGMAWLAGAMPQEQYKYLMAFVYKPDLFQDIDRDPKIDKEKGISSPAMREALELAAKSGN
ncbi:MAG: hypothetical protein J4452_02255 [Candidatus Aenigmarchaeota archaeon]|nr:hypothetical protein [Candidatus Aenigmarchaeota archaeon]